MLCLKSETKKEWVEAALSDLDSIFNDHAHCEKKAASTGMSLLSAYPEKTEISLTMADLIEEEMGHYKSVIEILNSLGKTLGKDQGDPYAKKLLGHIRSFEPKKLLDRLLTAGIIEARSCERLKILGENLGDKKLKEFYKDLAASEAGHYMTFIKLANLYFDEDEVRIRLDELAEFEREIVEDLPNKPMMHG